MCAVAIRVVVGLVVHGHIDEDFAMSLIHSVCVDTVTQSATEEEDGKLCVSR